ncbi:MAG: chromosome segregation protein SMC [Planctomycetota bacterium]|nr:chromosome segregation protein SMC [Planctomycetota bacterium]
MYLKKIHLAGFKSFADPVQFDFDPGTSAVVGPNGCGKSNVVDAFRWVLGERSAKGLRGSEMLDVIFKGTSKRAAHSRAEVRLLFDNEDGTLPIETAEVEIGRILLRDGTSEYEINRRRCRLKDILAIFADTGIGADGYSVLGQGQVDSFLNANAQERRKIFEEAAGISSFRKQRSETINRLDRSERELTRVTDQLSEIERRIRSLKMQAGKARKFVEDRDRFRHVSTVLAADDVERLNYEQESLKFRLSWRNTLRELIAEVSTQLDSSVEKVRNDIEVLHRQLEEVRQVETEKRVALQGIEGRRAQMKDQQDQGHIRNEDRQRQLEELVIVEEDYRQRRTEARSRIREAITELRQLRQLLAELKKDHALQLSKQEELDSTIRDLKDQDLGLVFEQSRLRNSMASHEGDLRGQDAIRERRTSEDLENRKQQSEVEVQIEDHEIRIREAHASEHEMMLQAETLRFEIGCRTDILGGARKKLTEVRGELESSHGRLQLLKDLEENLEGLSKGTQGMLNSEAPAAGDIRGLLARLIEADPETAHMVDAVLGRILETVVFQGRTPIEQRIRAITGILEGEAVNFVSLEDDLKAHTSREHGKLPADVETLAARVNCERLCRPIVDALLDEVLVAQDLNDALELRKSFPGHRVVTTEGHVIEPWGAVKIPAVNKSGLVSRQVEMNHLKDRVAELSSDLEEVSQQGDSLEESIAARQGELQRLEREMSRSKLEAEHALGERKRCRETLKRISDRRSSLKVDIQKAEQLTSELKTLKDLASQQLADIDAKKAQIVSKLESSEKALEPLAENLSLLESQIQTKSLEATRAQERISSDWREQRRLADEMEQRLVQRERILKDIVSEQNQIDLSIEDLKKLDTEETRLQSELATASEGRNELDVRLNSARSTRGQFEKKVKECRVRGDQIREGRESDLLAENECKVRIEGIQEKIKDDLEMDLEEAPIEEWRALLIEEDESSEDFSNRLRSDYQSLQDRIRRNSNVNLQAVEELETEESRFEEITGKIEDLTQSRDLIMEAIATLDDQCRTLFHESFEKVRGHFQEIFSLMFNGGTADLRLDDESDPLEAGIEVIAKPPGKRISSLRLLSGGERALTAISVIFALFKTRPSPFCILDEVDAPLDEQNTRRFVRVLQEFAQNSQFLVITHSRVTMAEAERLYGVTMEEQGVSRRVVVKIDDAEDWMSTNADEYKVGDRTKSKGGKSIFDRGGSAVASDPVI